MASTKALINSDGRSIPKYSFASVSNFSRSPILNFRYMLENSRYIVSFINIKFASFSPMSRESLVFNDESSKSKCPLISSSPKAAEISREMTSFVKRSVAAKTMFVISV